MATFFILIRFLSIVVASILLAKNVVDAGVAPATAVVVQKIEKRTSPSTFKWQVRLVNATLPYEGRVEVKLTPNGEWGSICDDGWDAYDAQVVCRMLGFNHAKARAVRGSTVYGSAPSTAPIHLDEVRCSGEERTLADCDYSAVHNCEHVEDAGVFCQGAMEDHFEHTAQLPKAFDHIQTLTNYFDTLRQAHLLLKNETDTIWRHFNYTEYERNRTNAEQVGLIERKIAELVGRNNGLGTYSGSESGTLVSQTAKLLILVPTLQHQLTVVEAKVSMVERALAQAVSSNDNGSIGATSAEKKIGRLEEEIQQLSIHFYWLLVGGCGLLVFLLVIGIGRLAYINSSAAKRIFNQSKTAPLCRTESYRREDSAISTRSNSNTNNNAQQSAPPHQFFYPQQQQQQQQGPRFEYKVPTVSTAVSSSNAGNKFILSYRRSPSSQQNANNNSILNMTSFFNGPTPVSLPPTPTSIPSFQQQTGRQSHNSGGLQIPHPPQAALPPVPHQQQIMFQSHQAAMQMLQQQQQSDANHRAAMLALAQQQAAAATAAAGSNASNYGYEPIDQNKVRYSLIMSESSDNSSVTADVGGCNYSCSSEPASPSYSSSTATVVGGPNSPQYADPYSIGIGQDSTSTGSVYTAEQIKMLSAAHGASGGQQPSTVL